MGATARFYGELRAMGTPSPPGVVIWNPRGCPKLPTTDTCHGLLKGSDVCRGEAQVAQEGCIHTSDPRPLMED